jgi:bifunctional DNA-binding transcriptional regulator/antitoxin component of YhaV-PrlF toxin-antitoxin module
MAEDHSEHVEIGRKEPLELDKRGRVTIPSNIRKRHGIQPEDGKEIWVEITIDEAEITYHQDDEDGGEQ